MSSILKALRKLEEEKAALGEGGADLSRDILKRSAPQRSRGNLLILKFALGIVLSLALLALLWILLGSTEHIETVAIPAVVETADSHQKAPPAPAPQAVQEQPVVERQSLSELVPPQKALTEEPIKVMTTAVDDPKIVEVEIEPVVITQV